MSCQYIFNKNMQKLSAENNLKAIIIKTYFLSRMNMLFTIKQRLRVNVSNTSVCNKQWNTDKENNKVTTALSRTIRDNKMITRN